MVILYLQQYIRVVHAVAFLVAISVTLPELLRASGIMRLLCADPLVCGHGPRLDAPPRRHDEIALDGALAADLRRRGELAMDLELEQLTFTTDICRS